MTQDKSPLDKPRNLNQVAFLFLVAIGIAAVVAIVIVVIGTHSIALKGH